MTDNVAVSLEETERLLFRTRGLRALDLWTPTSFNSHLLHSSSSDSDSEEDARRSSDSQSSALAIPASSSRHARRPHSPAAFCRARAANRYIEFRQRGNDKGRPRYFLASLGPCSVLLPTIPAAQPCPPRLSSSLSMAIAKKRSSTLAIAATRKSSTFRFVALRERDWFEILETSAHCLQCKQRRKL